MNHSLKDHLLIAMPSLEDSHFQRAVVYVCEHNEDGAMGLIINRPTRIKLADLLSHLQIENHAPWVQESVVLFGGPVHKEQGMVIHNSESPWKSTLPVGDGIFLTTSSEILAHLGHADGPQHAMVTLGYAGWGAGQLEQELADNSWLTVPAHPQLLFETPAESRWVAAAETLGIDIRLLSPASGHA